MAYERIVLVTRKTRLEGLIERFNTREQARFYIEHSGSSFEPYVREHNTYQRALAGLQQALQRLAKLHTIERGFLPNYLFSDKDIVVTIGVDGLVVNTAKYLHGQPLVAVNPDPQHIDGVLLPFSGARAPDVVRRLLAGRMKVKRITMAEARLNDGQALLAFNDFFIGVENHVSARYRIRLKGKAENHSSSGVIVSTGVGATGWLSSFYNMANGLLQSTIESTDVKLNAPDLPWDTEKLFFIVREPFVSKTSSAEIVCGSITREEPLVLESLMPLGGVIFSDGVASDYLGFNAGAIATIVVAERQTALVVG